VEDKRKQQLTNWVETQLEQLSLPLESGIGLVTVSGDASFRRYFRAQFAEQSFIAVDAPPASENSELFVEIAGYFRAAGVAAPKVFAQNFENGFLLLEDFGDQLYLPRLLHLQEASRSESKQQEIDKLYCEAIQSLIKIQSFVDKEKLSPYSRTKLHDEMQLFEDWFCGKYLGLVLSKQDRSIIADVFTFLEDAALGQIQLAVHRDYHSRNLLLLDSEKNFSADGPGVIDFQDAVAGAYSYDLVSLLRDCYIRWSPEQVEKWALYYFDLALKANLLEGASFNQFIRDFDLMGLQRNLKVMGIFSRLCIRDHKPQYLADIPLVIQYFLEVACQYEEMAPFLGWFEANVLPLAKSKLNLEF